MECSLKSCICISQEPSTKVIGLKISGAIWGSRVWGSKVHFHQKCYSWWYGHETYDVTTSSDSCICTSLAFWPIFVGSMVTLGSGEVTGSKMSCLTKCCKSLMWHSTIIWSSHMHHYSIPNNLGSDLGSQGSNASFYQIAMNHRGNNIWQ